MRGLPHHRPDDGCGEHNSATPTQAVAVVSRHHTLLQMAGVAGVHGLQPGSGRPSATRTPAPLANGATTLAGTAHYSRLVGLTGVPAGPVRSLANAHDHGRGPLGSRSRPHQSRRRRSQGSTLSSRRRLRSQRPRTDSAPTPSPSIGSGGAGQAQRTGALLIKDTKREVPVDRGDDLRVEQNGRGGQTGIAGNRATLRRYKPDPLRGRGVLDTPAEFGEVLGEACWPPARRRRLRGLLAVRIPGDRPGGFLGQAVTAGLVFWRGRRLRGAAAAAVVAPGLRPRFFSVLPTPANFRSR
jgi:hypothetical protein